MAANRRTPPRRARQARAEPRGRARWRGARARRARPHGHANRDTRPHAATSTLAPVRARVLTSALAAYGPREQPPPGGYLTVSLRLAPGRPPLVGLDQNPGRPDDSRLRDRRRRWRCTPVTRTGPGHDRHTV